MLAGVYRFLTPLMYSLFHFPFFLTITDGTTALVFFLRVENRLRDSCRRDRPKWIRLAGIFDHTIRERLFNPLLDFLPPPIFLTIGNEKIIGRSKWFSQSFLVGSAAHCVEWAAAAAAEMLTVSFTLFSFLHVCLHLTVFKSHYTKWWNRFTSSLPPSNLYFFFSLFLSLKTLCNKKIRVGKWNKSATSTIFTRISESESLLFASAGPPPAHSSFLCSNFDRICVDLEATIHLQVGLPGISYTSCTIFGIHPARHPPTTELSQQVLRQLRYFIWF